MIANGLEEREDEWRLHPEYKTRFVPDDDEQADAVDWVVDLVHDLVMELARA